MFSVTCAAMYCGRIPNSHVCLFQKLDTAVEVLCTLKELLSNIEPEKFMLYPQLFLASISLLNSSVVKIGELTMEILYEVMQ